MPVVSITDYGIGSPDKPANDTLRAQRKLRECMPPGSPEQVRGRHERHSSILSVQELEPRSIDKSADNYCLAGGG